MKCGLDVCGGGGGVHVMMAHRPRGGEGVEWWGGYVWWRSGRGGG